MSPSPRQESARHENYQTGRNSSGFRPVFQDIELLQAKELNVYESVSESVSESVFQDIELLLRS